VSEAQIFSINDPDYFICRLEPEQVEPLQRLIERCADFTQLVEGEGVSPQAAQDIFRSVPEGRSIRDKFVYGVLDQKGTIEGVLEGIRHYPDDSTWWIGLLLLAPETRGHGLGQKVIQAFSEYVDANQGAAIMLGVVEQNRAAYRFWQQQGFELVRQTEPRTFGKKTQTVYVMRKELIRASGKTKPSNAAFGANSL
jgi:ribosomal protein S18 acetylase RimI-like enzyme